MSLGIDVTILIVCIGVLAVIGAFYVISEFGDDILALGIAAVVGGVLGGVGNLMVLGLAGLPKLAHLLC